MNVKEMGGKTVYRLKQKKKKLLKNKPSYMGQLSLAFNTCREEVMRRGRREENGEGGREALL